MPEALEGQDWTVFSVLLSDFNSKVYNDNDIQLISLNLSGRKLKNKAIHRVIWQPDINHTSH